jgi:hypothetical protein
VLARAGPNQHLTSVFDELAAGRCVHPEHANLRAYFRLHGTSTLAAQRSGCYWRHAAAPPVRANLSGSRGRTDSNYRILRAICRTPFGCLEAGDRSDRQVGTFTLWAAAGVIAAVVIALLFTR